MAKSRRSRSTANPNPNATNQTNPNNNNNNNLSLPIRFPQGELHLVRGFTSAEMHAYYDSVRNVIRSVPNFESSSRFLKRIMERNNEKWKEIVEEIKDSIESLEDHGVTAELVHILQANTYLARLAGPTFYPQIARIFLDLVIVYNLCSELLHRPIEENLATKIIVGSLRCVKQEILRLMKTFLDRAEDDIGKQFLSVVLDLILPNSAVDDVEDSDVFTLLAALMDRYKGEMEPFQDHIRDVILSFPYEMLVSPEHEAEDFIEFFTLLEVISTQDVCFLPQSVTNDSIIREYGVSILLRLLGKIEDAELTELNQFHRTYFFEVEASIFQVLMDPVQKASSDLVDVLLHLFRLVGTQKITEPIWDPSTATVYGQSNKEYVGHRTETMLVELSHTNVADQLLVREFIENLFSSTQQSELFLGHVVSFLQIVLAPHIGTVVGGSQPSLVPETRLQVDSHVQDVPFTSLSGDKLIDYAERVGNFFFGLVTGVGGAYYINSDDYGISSFLGLAFSMIVSSSLLVMNATKCRLVFRRRMFYASALTIVVLLVLLGLSLYTNGFRNTNGFRLKDDNPISPISPSASWSDLIQLKTSSSTNDVAPS